MLVKQIKLWIIGARPRTLFISVAPVILGTALAVKTTTMGEKNLDLVNFVLALLVAVFIQVGTNYVNDYFDGIKGADVIRVGPQRLVGGNLMSPEGVKRLALAAFLVACVAGLVLAIRVNPYLILLGALCVIAGIFYTAGPKPYGYIGLGEVFVFIFFGLVATVGSAYLQNHQLNVEELIAGCALGLQATAVLMVNNIRDIDTDKLSNKMTLSVRIGKKNSKILVVLAIAISSILNVLLAVDLKEPFVFLGLLSYVVFFKAIANIFKDEPRYLIAALKLISLGELLFSLLISALLFI